MTDQFSTTATNIPKALLKEETLATGEERVLPVLEEQIDIQKVVVETGAVPVRKIVHEDTDSFDTTLKSEEVIITRVPMEKVVADIFNSRQEGDTLIIPIFKEVFTRQIVLVEEVHMTTRRIPKSTTQHITLKREEVVVERYYAQSRLWNPHTAQWYSVLLYKRLLDPIPSIFLTVASHRYAGHGSRIRKRAEGRQACAKGWTILR